MFPKNPKAIIGIAIIALAVVAAVNRIPQLKKITG